MKLFDLIRQESDLRVGRLCFIGAVSGITNALLLIIVNVVLDGQEPNNSFRLLVLFVASLATFAITRSHLLLVMNRELEQILHKLRTRIVDKIRRADLLSLEKLGRAEIYASVQRDTLAISAIGQPLVTVVQSLMLMALGLVYIAYLSLWAFLYAGGIIIGASLFYIVMKRSFADALREVLNRENKVFKTLNHVLDGIKEVQLNEERSEDIMGYARDRSVAARDLRTETEGHFITLSIFAQLALYGGLGILVFLAPALHTEYPAVAFEVTLAFIFLMGPVFGTVGSIPILYQVESAVDSILKIESQLDEALLPPGGASPRVGFQEIRLDEVFFQFEDPRRVHPFGVGPLDLTITAGQVLFLVGGNGTGKSTLLKLITGLYRPRRGALRLDGAEINEFNYRSYQSLFSTVFSDFHLFDRFYGLGDIDPDRIAELFEKMQLTGKTSIIDGKFATLDLSTGQRKRLAMIVALLEDRPIYIFDEWAAEQDPVFRRSFYHELIPELKSLGKTIIAVSHDDRYFSTADTILKMEDGKLVDLPEE